MHLGREGEIGACDHWVRSDTLFSGLVAAALARGIMRDLFPDGVASAPFLLTSVFPCWYEVPFYPRPFLPAPPSDQGRPWKRIRFVSEQVLASWLAARPLGLVDHDGDPAFAISAAELGTRKFPQTLQRITTAPANLVDRRISAATPYQRGQLLINTAEGAGLFLLADLEPQHLAPFQLALAELGALGLGGERSTGMGTFELQSMEPYPGPLPPGNSGSHFVTLSLLSPTRDEVEAGLLEDAAYDTIRRGGWIWWGADTGLRKRKLRMLTEGSVLRHLGRAHYGAAVDVTPAAFTRGRVYRWGKAFPIFFAPPQEGRS